MISSVFKYFIDLISSFLGGKQALRIFLKFALMCLYFKLLHQLKFLVKILTDHTDFLSVFYFLRHRISEGEPISISYTSTLSRSFYDIFLIFCQLLIYSYLGNMHMLLFISFNFEEFKRLFQPLQPKYWLFRYLLIKSEFFKQIFPYHK